MCVGVWERGMWVCVGVGVGVGCEYVVCRCFVWV